VRGSRESDPLLAGAAAVEMLFGLEHPIRRELTVDESVDYRLKLPTLGGHIRTSSWLGTH
jgi:hypothetical protein